MLERYREDLEAELKRLSKRMAEVEDKLARSERKLQNPGFLEKAPAEVVETERARVAQLQSDLSKLQAQRTALEDAAP